MTQSDNQTEIGTVIRRLLEIGRAVVPGAANWCVAGGAVRDQYLDREPHDYDLFIMGLDQISGEMNQGFQREGLTLSTRWRQEYLMNHMMEYITPGGKLVHIIATPLIEIEALLDTFDWNICHHAISRDGTAVNGGFPAVNLLRLQPGSLVKPLTALKRGFRFAERYGMTIAPEDLRTLIEGSMVQLDEEEQGLTWDPVMREPRLTNNEAQIAAMTDDIFDDRWTTAVFDRDAFVLTDAQPPAQELTIEDLQQARARLEADPMMTVADTLRTIAVNMGMVTAPVTTGGTNAQ